MKKIIIGVFLLGTICEANAQKISLGKAVDVVSKVQRHLLLPMRMQ
jgi:putative metalloprotease